MFSGTAFYQSQEGILQIAQIPWDREAYFKLPIAVWKQMMDAHFPNSAWLSLRREAFAQLYDYKVRHGLPTWEHVIARLLASEEIPREKSDEVTA